MILPDKTLRLSSTLLFRGSELLSLLRYPRTVSETWDRVRESAPAVPFETFLLTLTLLYSLGLVELQEGLLSRVRP